MTSLLLNKIVLKNGKTYHGIIDYVTKRQVYFFDFSEMYKFNTDLLIMAMMWKGNSSSNIRFSIYVALNYPNFPLPPAKLIPAASIEECDIPLNETPKGKQRRRKIDVSALESD